MNHQRHRLVKGMTSLSVVLLLLFFAWDCLDVLTARADPGDIAFQGFEGGGPANEWTYTLNPTSYNTEGDPIVNGDEDVWAIIEEFTGDIDDSVEGTNFWGMQDLDNSSGGGSFAHTLTFNNVDISSYTDVELSLAYNVIGYDTPDDIEYEVFLDNVGQGTVVLFAGGTGGVSTSGWETQTIAVPNGTLQVSFVLSATQNGAEDYAGFDNICLTGATGGPTISVGGATYPNALTYLVALMIALAALGCSILAGSAVAFRKRAG